MERGRAMLLAAGILVILVVAFLCTGSWSGQERAPAREVIVYTSVDQVYSEPVLRHFENRTGIRVLPVYDVEAAKTTGLVNRLIAEKSAPRADLFWNGEIIQTLRLEREGVLSQYDSPAAAGIPQVFRSPSNSWTGFGGRARVILINTERLGNNPAPMSLRDFLDERYPPDSIGIANPVFGTSSTHAAGLYALLGRENARALYGGMRDRKIRVLDGNSVVRDLVAQGQLAFGLTDSDDACGAVERGAPVRIAFPDQGEGEPGTIIIPNTVAVIAGAPHEPEARALADYLLSRETEDALVQAGWIQIPARTAVPPGSCINPSGIRLMNLSYESVYPYLAQSQQDLREIFIR